MRSNPMCSTETDAQETTPLLNSECSSRYVKNSQLESGPSCSASPIYRRSFSADTLSLDTAVGKRTSSLSPDRYSQQNQPPSSRSEPFCNVRKRVELRLENSGSVARDHLASERTFLAYMRTSLATTSAGVALIQLFSVTSTHASWHKLNVYVRLLGASTVIVGLLVLFIGIARYFTVQVALTKGVFPVARLATGFVGMMLGVLVTLTFGVLLAGRFE